MSAERLARDDPLRWFSFCGTSLPGEIDMADPQDRLTTTERRQFVDELAITLCQLKLYGTIGRSKRHQAVRDLVDHSEAAKSFKDRVGRRYEPSPRRIDKLLAEADAVVASDLREERERAEENVLGYFRQIRRQALQALQARKKAKEATPFFELKTMQLVLDTVRGEADVLGLNRQKVELSGASLTDAIQWFHDMANGSMQEDDHATEREGQEGPVAEIARVVEGEQSCQPNQE